MNILAFETSSDRGSVALWHPDGCVEHLLDGAANHSGRILATIRAVLAEADSSLDSLNAVAFGAGPGAFTGLRLGCGVAQGLALATGLPIVPVPSLDVLAAAAGPGQIWAVTDARMGEVYGAHFSVSEDCKVLPLMEPRCALPEQIEAPRGEGLICTGSAFGVYENVLLTRLMGAPVRVLADEVPRASWVARLAAARLAAGLGCRPEEAVPLYVRDKVALTTAERLARGGRV